MVGWTGCGKSGAWCPDAAGARVPLPYHKVRLGQLRTGGMVTFQLVSLVEWCVQGTIKAKFPLVRSGPRKVIWVVKWTRRLSSPVVDRSNIDNLVVGEGKECGDSLQIKPPGNYLQVKLLILAFHR